MPRRPKTPSPRTAAPVARARLPLAILDRTLGFASALVWTVIGIAFVTYVVLRSTGVGVWLVIREEWGTNRP